MLQQAQQYYAGGQLAQAQQLFSRLNAQQPQAAEPLEFLAMLALQAGKGDEAVSCFRQLTENFPDNPLYVDRLASLLAKLGKPREALKAYRRLLDARPQLVASRFNYASLLRRLGENEEALSAYQRCLDDGIEQPEEVLSTLGSILADLNRDEEAASALNRALSLNPGYAPAHYNLALYHEESGNWERAKEHFQRIAQADPLYPRAIARLVQGETIGDKQHPLIGQVTTLLKSGQLPLEVQEELHFALAKALDDCGQYTRAFGECQRANALASKRTKAYQREREEQWVTSIIGRDEAADWSAIQPVSQAPLVFICGLFRSGSTLLEQMLGAHPGLVPGGEIDFFPRHLPPGNLAAGVCATQAEEAGRAYLQYLDKHYPAGARVINKRLDNGYYVGLLRQLFPHARFLRTMRHPLDNAVSIFFQQLAGDFPYANNLMDIGHYWLQQQRLLDHWALRYPQSVTAVHYEDLVARPQQTLEPVLLGLGLDWDDACLAFHQQRVRVRTASVAQVRKPLYTTSANRWQHYADQLEPLRELLVSEGAPGLLT